MAWLKSVCLFTGKQGKNAGKPSLTGTAVELRAHISHLAETEIVFFRTGGTTPGSWNYGYKDILCS